MKKLTFLISLCFLTSILIAQDNGVKNFSKNAGLKNSLFLKYQPSRHFQAGNFDEKNISLLKSSNEEKQKLDSIIYSSYDFDAGQWTVEQKYVFEYNSNGNLIQDQLFWKDENDNWKPDTQNRHYYDDSQRIIQVSSYYMPEFNRQLKEDYREVYTYYNNGKLDETLSGSFNTSGQLKYFNKEKNYYDDEDRLIKTIYSSNYSVWEENNMEEYFYKPDTIQIVMSYRDFTEEWLQGSIVESIFNEIGNIVRYNEYIQPEGQTEFSIGYYTLYNYDSNNNLSSVIDIYRDFETGNFFEGSREQYVYDEEQNLTDYILSSKYYGSNDWHEMLKQTYNQDYSFSMENLITPYIFSEDFSMFKHMLTGFTSLGKMENEEKWIEGEKGDLYYSDFTLTQMQTYADIDCEVYPNPAKDLIYVKYDPQMLKSLSIYNSHGQLLRFYTLDPNTITKEINITGFCQGVYLFQLNGEIGNSTKKIIIN